MIEKIESNVYDECEIHENCTVEIWRNSDTGEVSIGWYEKDNPPVISGNKGDGDCSDS